MKIKIGPLGGIFIALFTVLLAASIWGEISFLHVILFPFYIVLVVIAIFLVCVIFIIILLLLFFLIYLIIDGH